MSAFEFDPAKQKKNLRVHKIGLDVGARIFEGFTIEAEDDRFDYGEERLIALGADNGRVLVVVYTWRGGNPRIISARKARKDEKEIYYQTLARHRVVDPD